VEKVLLEATQEGSNFAMAEMCDARGGEFGFNYNKNLL
jgi:hypothetical protein